MEISAEWTTGGGLDVEPYVAFGSYDGTLDVTTQWLELDCSECGPPMIVDGPDDTELEAEGEVGYLAGVRVGKALTPNLSLHATAGYRWLEMDFGPIDGYSPVPSDVGSNSLRFDLGGHSFGGGVTYHF